MPICELVIKLATVVERPVYIGPERPREAERGQNKPVMRLAAASPHSRNTNNTDTRTHAHTHIHTHTHTLTHLEAHLEAIKVASAR